MGFISWFSRNPVAANLLLIFIAMMGTASAYRIDKQLFPSNNINTIQISVAYPGASPTSIDQAIIVKIEDSIKHVRGIRQINSTAREGVGVIEAEIHPNARLGDIIDDIKAEIETIVGLPEDSRQPIVKRKKEDFNVLRLSISGPTDQLSLQKIALFFQKQLQALPNIDSVNIESDNEIIISIEISEDNLLKYQLTFDDIAQKIRQSSISISAGNIESSTKNLSLRIHAKANSVQSYNHISIKTLTNGRQIRLGDIANIKETLLKRQGISRFNKKPAINLSISSASRGNDIKTSNAVKQWLNKVEETLPQGITVMLWGDSSYYLNERLNTMLKNLFFGAVLVFIILSLFLRLNIAFWVMMSIPITFLGTIWLMPISPYPISINIVSLFAFILALGIVIDDGIIIGESIYTETIEKKNHSNGIIIGVKKVIIPASFGVLTTIAAFLPMLFIGGSVASYFESISMVIILCLFFSLIESKLILPAHLSSLQKVSTQNGWNKVQINFNQHLKHFILTIYRPLLDKAIRYRYTTLSLFLGILIITIGLITGNILKVVVFPNIPSDFIAVKLEMNPGITEINRDNTLQELEDIIYQSNTRSSEKSRNFLQHVVTYSTGSTTGTIVAELSKGQNRKINAYEIADLWRDRFPKNINIKSIEIIAGESAGNGKPINIQLYSSDSTQLISAAEQLKQQLTQYNAVYDAETNYRPGADEIVINMLPYANSLGISLSDISQQVRQGFHGEEVERFHKNSQETIALLRYPASSRHKLSTLQNMLIKTAAGDQIPISEVATFSTKPGYESIYRQNGLQSILVSANVYDHLQAPGEILNEILQFIPNILSSYPAVEYNLAGGSQEAAEVQEKLLFAAITAFFLIFSLLAIPLKSYVKPFIILAVVPFGVIGAVVGHLLFGISISMLSILGLIALIGVLVNDSLILIDYTNSHKNNEQSLMETVISAGCARFRAIILTSLTTFCGLVPILFEKSLQAQLIIPMAISLSFGILFATVITLFLVPCIYMILEDIKCKKSKYLPS